MRFTRWTNQTLPQTLQIAVFLLYVNTVLSVLSLLGSNLGGSAYYFVGWLLPNSARDLNQRVGLVTLIVLAAAAVYLLAGLLIADGQKLGWSLGVGVAVGAVVLPLVTIGLRILSTNYVITYMFDAALVACLLHPQSREYKKIWFR
ncbi:MAG: hypothetical protein JWM05_605 [Acidimicrobiales bacterium]|nr:hypothetical protein [Acidimicrobiales bacterium]